MSSNQTKQSSPLVIAIVAALGLVSGLAIARFRFKLPKPPKGWLTLSEATERAGSA